MVTPECVLLVRVQSQVFFGGGRVKKKKGKTRRPLEEAENQAALDWGSGAERATCAGVGEGVRAGRLPCSPLGSRPVFWRSGR